MPFDPTGLPLVITQWRNVKNPVGMVLDTTWGVYLRSKRFRDPATFASKTALMGWSPVAFTGGRRRKDAAERAYGIALDYEPEYIKIPKDAPPEFFVAIARPGATFTEARELWGAYYGLIHTTWSHKQPTKAGHPAEPGPRFRVILPTTRPISPEEYGYVWTWAAGIAADARHPIDPSTKDVSRLWYVPGRAEGYPYEACDLDGSPIDPDPICEAARAEAARATEARAEAERARVATLASAKARGARVDPSMLGPAPAGTPSRRAYVDRALERAVRELRDAAPGTRNPALAKQAYGLGGFVATGELDEATVTAALTEAVSTAGCNAQQIASTIRSNIASGKQKPRWAPDRVVGSREEPVETPAPTAESEGFTEAPERVYEIDAPPDPFADADVVAPLPPRTYAMPEPEVAPEPEADEGEPYTVRDLVRDRAVQSALDELQAAIGGEPPEPPAAGGDEAGAGGPPRFVPVQIQITTREREVADQAIEALADSDEPVFTRAGELVHIIEEGAISDEESTAPPSDRRTRLNMRRQRASLRLPPGAPSIRGLTVPGVRSLLAHVCQFGRMKYNEKTDEEYWVDAHPPIWCVSDVHSRGNWPDIRPLTAIVECPMLRGDGSITDRPGYDEITGLFVRPAGGWPVVPESPTREDARAAADLLLALVKDFPFEEDCHRSGWLAALLTPLCRHAYRGVSPMFVIDANVRGVGKSKLCDIISIIICGRPMARQSESNDETEEKKQITTILKSGVPMVLFDNLSKPLGSGHLDSLLTGEDWSDRIFGTQNNVTVPNMCALYATGNNVALKGDMSRRIQHIRLQSDRENPEDRNDFASDNIINDTRANRMPLLGAALTIIRAFCAARSSPGFEAPDLPRWGSFEEWSAIVRGAIVWVGLDDPAKARKGLSTFADSQVSALAGFLKAWREFAPEGMTAAEAVRKLEDDALDDRGRRNGKHRPMLEAIGELMKTHNGIPTASALGYRLRNLRNRVVGGECLRGTGAQSGVMKWTVCRMTDPQVTATEE